MREENINVLLVEDNLGDVRLIEEYLTAKGDSMFVMDHVRSLQEARNYLDEGDVDLILLDLGLPGSQGVGTFHTLHEYTPDIPILVLTGLDDEEIALKCVHAGAQDYLVKDHIDEFSLPRAARYAWERERTLKELKESEERYRAVVENSHDGILIVGEDYRLEYVNDMLCEILGRDRDEILGQDFREFLDEPSQRLVGERYVKRQRGEKVPPRYEFNLLRRDGEKRRVEISSTIIRDSQGKVKTIAQIKDITERKLTEASLKRSEARYRRIFENVPVSIWEEDFTAVQSALQDLKSRGVTDLEAYMEEHPEFVDRMGELIEVWDVNAVTLSMFGAESKEQLLGSLDEIITSDTRQILREEILAIHQGRTYIEGETVNRTLQGKRLDFWLTMDIPAEGEKLDRVLISMMDITERKQAEEALVEREKKYRAIFENANDAMYLHKLTAEGMPGLFIEVNDVACEMLGYTKEEFASMSTRDIDDPEAAAKVPEIMDALLTQGEATFEMQHVTKQGDKVPVEISSHLFSLNNQRVVLSIARDITERKEAERALKESEEKYRRFFQTSQDCVFITTREGRWLEMNQAAVDLFGYESKEELARVNVRDLYANPEYRKEHLKVIVSKGFSKDYPVKLRKKDGSIIHARISSTLYYQDGEHVGYQGTIRDVTDMVQYIEEIKRKSDQLNAVREIGLELVSELDVDELLEDVVIHAVNLMDGTGGSFNILDPDRQVLKMDVHKGYKSLPEDTTIKRGEGLIGQVWAKRENISIEDYAAWEDHVPQWVDHIGHRAMIGIPVKWGEEILGVLEINREPKKPFSDEDVWLLEMFANQAAAAIRNAKIFDHAEQRLSRLRSLRQIDQTISGSLDLKTTLDVLIDRLIQNLEVDAGTILLYRPPLNTLEYVTGSGFRSEALRQTKLRIGECHAGRAALERKIVHIPDLTLETVRFERAKLIRQEDFVAYFGVPLIAKGEIVGVLEVFHRNSLDPSPEWIDFLKTLAGQAAIAIDHLNLFNDLERSNIDLIRAYNEVIEGWARALELRDQETEGHSRRVEELTLAIARELGIDEEELAHVRHGALLHDIGKMGVSDQILKKPGKLTEDEWEIMKKHPIFAYDLLSPFDHLKPALDIPYCHHEKWDGSGYPRGLRGEEIPLSARIFAVVDVWDALRSDRPYRDAWSDEKALAYIKEQSGKHFDPQVVQIFLNVIQEWGVSNFDDKFDSSN